MHERAVFEIEDCSGPGPARAQFGRLGFELLDRQPAHERGVIHEAVIIAAEEVARDRAAGGFKGVGADKSAEIGIERDGRLGQEAAHGVGRDVRLVLELVPDRALRGMVAAEREGRDRFEGDGAAAVGIEQLGRELAEAQALLDMALGGAEAARDVFDRGAAVDQRRHSDELVGRMHRRADRVLGQRGFDCVFGLLDLAVNLVIGINDAFGRELLQDPERRPPAST